MTVETTEAHTKILSIKSSKHSKINSNKVFGGIIIGSFVPKCLLLVSKSYLFFVESPNYKLVFNFIASPSMFLN